MANPDVPHRRWQLRSTTAGGGVVLTYVDTAVVVSMGFATAAEFALFLADVTSQFNALAGQKPSQAKPKNRKSV